MKGQTRIRLLTFAALVAIAPASSLLGGCDALTAPPEPISVDTTTGAVTAKPNMVPPSAQSAHTIAPVGNPSAAPVPPPQAEGKLEIKDLVVGKGPEAKSGDTVSVHYVGTLTNGTEFDSSRKRGQPFTFPLGQGRVIKGWDQGVAGMKVGGKRKLTIPPSLGYGDRGAGTIPPNSTLVFEVELLDIKGANAK